MPSTMSETVPPSPTGNPPEKPRRPLERLLVRGFIGVMLMLVAVEANSWWQHKRAMDPLIRKIEAGENTPNIPALTEADVKAVLGSKNPSRTEALRGGQHYGTSRLDVYSWFTISPFNKREIYVYYRHQEPGDKNGPAVLAID